MLITFSGLDGAGKSTLIESVTRTLARLDKPVAVVHMNHDIGIYSLLRLVRNVVRGSGGSRAKAARVSTGPSKRPATLASRVRYAIVWNKTLRALLYPIDLLIFLALRLYIELVRGQVLVMDRYFYDTLVDVSGGGRQALLRVLHAITPTPALAVFVEVSPEVAFARKGEYSVAYLRSRLAAYRAVFRWVPSTIFLPNTDLAASRSVLEQLVVERAVAS